MKTSRIFLISSIFFTLTIIGVKPTDKKTKSAPVASSSTQATPHLTENLELDAQAIAAQIETAPLELKQYLILTEEIENLSFLYEATAQRAQENLFNMLEVKFAPLFSEPSTSTQKPIASSSISQKKSQKDTLRLDTNNLESDVEVITTRIETTPLSFEQYLSLKKAIEDLSIPYKDAAQKDQEALSKLLEDTFTLKLPEIETRNLLKSIKNWDIGLKETVEQNIKTTFATDKNLQQELLKELAAVTKKMVSKKPQPIAQEPEKDFLLEQISSFSWANSKQDFDAAIINLLEIPFKKPLVAQQKVDVQKEADCGYHALKNALAIALNKKPEELTKLLLPIWKKFITTRRASDKKNYPLQGSNMLEGAEITILFQNDPENLLKNTFKEALRGVTLTVSEDPFNMWHDFISLRNAAQLCSKNPSCAHLFVIGTGSQVDVLSTGKKNLGGHWFSLVVKQENHKRSYITAESAKNTDRRADPRTTRIIQLFEALIHLYDQY